MGEAATAIEAGEMLSLIQTPLAGDNPCGEDPRYSDDFSAIKTEVEKLSGTDFDRIKELAASVLSKESKDLRVLGYLALAELREEGVAALADVVRGYTFVLENWWEQCHPQRPNARQAAIDWLNNPRFVAFVEHVPDASDAAALESLQEAIKALLAQIGERLPDMVPPWRELKEAVAKRLKAQQQSAPAAPPSNDQPAANKEAPQRREPTPSAPPPPASAAGGKIGSDKEFTGATREILTYLRQQRDWQRMVGYARAFRWGGMPLPPNEGGRTRIPAPRQPALAAVETAMGKNAWEDAFLACESAFMEPGGQFCLQLQQWAEQAATQMNQPQLAALIANETRGLLERLPGLVELRYDNDEPFVAASCEAWLDELRQAGGEGGGHAAPAVESDIPEADAKAAAKADGLAAGLAVLDAHPAKSARERAAVTLAKARICLGQGRAELAYPALHALATQLEDSGAANWAPDFAVQVWRALEQATKSGGKKAGLSEADVKAQLAQLKAKICQADLTAAAAIY
ncbi:type VI secretion system ImpA domain-containing protein [Alkalilimnicola ehrlichii]|uniref:Type VI secretion system ImpA domain-containing protein n=1 Tax=Alkalilimnicola ehrlichii TaxID=351052 RepID=A0A3E0WVL4_9GAMM|nr:type VI secretion system protein TssA [Alkalilimnicola ehrlichii]RFA29851.1 type VI secretion system ImpA domain-containing protein [Alkalilimnicola ehrlichii]RFA36439.1 type VI secretion system ImpA domain-containing protein [Alkalilimnicola ehrlichii]